MPDGGAMLSVAVVVAAAVLWLGLLFGTALYAERRPGVLAGHWRHVYALSLAVYCTSWTFFGTVTQAARYDWPLPPTFVGTLLLYALGAGLMLQLVKLARASNATSIADLIATRLGKDAWLAAGVTLIAVLGLIPYVALQLKAVSMSFALLTDSQAGADQPPWRDSSLYVALVMGLFAMLFGTRRASAAEHNRGLVLAMAFESLFKLVAMLALGAVRLAGPGIAIAAVIAGSRGIDRQRRLHPAGVAGRAGDVHPAAPVPCRRGRMPRRAPRPHRALAVPAVPRPDRAAGAAAGARRRALLAGQGVPSDLYVLALPLAIAHRAGAVRLPRRTQRGHRHGGGQHAHLSLMIGNHWLAPLACCAARGRAATPATGAATCCCCAGSASPRSCCWPGPTAARSPASGAGRCRRAVVLGAGDAGPGAGLRGVAPQTPPRAALGYGRRFLTWAWCLLVPLLAAFGATGAGCREGPFGIAWLAPRASSA
jgi:hypothetical protein